MANPPVATFFASLGLDIDETSFLVGTKVLDGLASTVLKFGGFVAGAFAVDAVRSFVANTIEAIPAINDVAQQTGLAAEEVQRLGFAAGQSGASSEQLNGALLKLTKNIGEAAKGGEAAVEAFGALGISTAGIADRSPREVLGQIADGLAKVQGRARQAEIATSLFGLSGTKLVPFLSQGSQAIADLGAEAEALGLVLTGDAVVAVDALDDRLNAAKATVFGAGRALVVALLPALEKGVALFDRAARGVARFTSFLVKNEKTVKVVAATVGTILAGALLKFAAAAVTAGIASLTALAANSTLTVSYGVLAGVIDIASLALVRWIGRLAAAALPILAVAGLLAAIVLIGDDILTFLRGGDSAIGRLVGRFDELRDALAAVVVNPNAHPLLRFLAAIGTVGAAQIDLVDKAIAQLFDSIGLVVDIAGLAADAIMSPLETLRFLFRETLLGFSEFIGAAFQLASKAAGILAEVSPVGAGQLGTLSTRLAEVNAGTVAGGILQAAPIVGAAAGVSSTSNSVTVGAPSFDVKIDGAAAGGDAKGIADAFVDNVVPAVERIFRAAGAALLPDAG